MGGRGRWRCGRHACLLQCKYVQKGANTHAGCLEKWAAALKGGLAVGGSSEVRLIVISCALLEASFQRGWIVLLKMRLGNRPVQIRLWLYRVVLVEWYDAAYSREQEW